MIDTPLYNPYNYSDVTKLNMAIKSNFMNCVIQNDSAKLAPLSSLISWNNKDFDLAINVNKVQQQAVNKLKKGERLVSLGDELLFELNIGQRITNNQLINDGKIPVYSANVKKPFGFINELLINDFSKPSIIWGIDGDWQVGYIKENIKFYPTDHLGYLRIKTDTILPRYIVSLIEEQGKKLGFSRTNRASLQQMKKMQIVIPSLEEQKKVVLALERLEYEQEKTEKEIVNLQGQIIKTLESVGGKKLRLDSITNMLIAGCDAPKEKSDVKTEIYKYLIYSNGEKNDGLYGWCSEAKVNTAAVTISARGTIGFVKLREANFTPIVRLIVAVPNEKKILAKC